LEGGVQLFLVPEAKAMLRFDQMIRRDMVVRDVKQRHPKTIPVFEEFGFHPICDDCEIVVAARKNGLNAEDVTAALNRAAFGADPGAAGTEEHANH
jgi:hypothetical protein